ncbi:hypothetical protein [Urbifossiella limnaea]|uniref:DUF4351 domain-containing protein n=1 Tax=Urbifossiella limnaea TaxID=2528023 RepID=A0A517XL22_9BACT|nr:hypothetical protein [Urbifossiella limnaea]QDU18208.1 hypothetical protein ETAA1_00910 [Urbifossiella limnaea]
MTLEDSTTYQLILRRGKVVGQAEGKVEGQVEEARRFVTRFGTRQFGPPPAAVDASLAAIADRDRLERMFDAIPTAAGWDDLLTTP